VTHQLVAYLRFEAGCRNPVRRRKAPASGYTFSRLGCFPRAKAIAESRPPRLHNDQGRGILRWSEIKPLSLSLQGATFPIRFGLGFSWLGAHEHIPGFEKRRIATPDWDRNSLSVEPDSPGRCPPEASTASLLLDCEQVRPGVHSANHHSSQDECRYQEAPGEHIRFPNLSLRPE
jgi:hypothetical protein